MKSKKIPFYIIRRITGHFISLLWWRVVQIPQHNNRNHELISNYGTLIEAFCADGTYYKVNSTESRSTQHPFTLALPTGVDCRLVMTVMKMIS